MGATKLTCRECGADYGLEARYVCDRCFGPLEVAYEHDVQDVEHAAPAHPGRPAEHLALPRLPAARGPAAAHAHRACPPAARRSSAPTAWPQRLGVREVWVKNDAANPTHSFKDRVVSVASARARELGFTTLACASTGNLANSVAAHGAALGMDTYVFIPSDLEEQKILATGIYGTKLVKVKGNYDDVNRLCTELSGERDWAFVNVNVRPYYAEGSKTLGLRDRRAARLGGARPRRGADRLGLALHEDRQGLPGLPRPRPRERARRPS